MPSQLGVNTCCIDLGCQVRWQAIPRGGPCPTGVRNGCGARLGRCVCPGGAGDAAAAGGIGGLSGTQARLQVPRVTRVVGQAGGGLF